jgi:hypothetical protein
MQAETGVALEIRIKRYGLIQWNLLQSDAWVFRHPVTFRKNLWSQTYLLILISKATPVSACIGRCSNRITVSFNATFTLLKTEVKQKFDEAPSHKSVMIFNHIQIVSAKIVLNHHRFSLPHWQNLSHKAFLVIVSILHYCLIHLRVLAFVYL